LHIIFKPRSHLSACGQAQAGKAHPSEIRSAVFFKEFHGAGPSEIRSAVTIVNFMGQSKGKILCPAG